MLHLAHVEAIWRDRFSFESLVSETDIVVDGQGGGLATLATQRELPRITQRLACHRNMCSRSRGASP